jgi:1-acyl-sn-glycerol-3-phosphate acyltransferase
MSSFHQEVVKVSRKIDNFFNTTFQEIEMDGPELNFNEIQKHPLMIICTHRSHVDYFLIGYKLFKKGLKNMRFAAGDNLTKLPWIGPRFKAWGAFTVERDTGFERNYVRNLCQNVVKMLERNEAVILFPEGGRSYSGGMLEIKGGILGAAIIAQAKNYSQDVYYLPAAVSYEVLPDLPFFKMLLKGKKLRKKGNNFFKRMYGNILYFGGDLLAFVPFLLAPRLKRKYGKVYIDYQEPVKLTTVLDIKANMQENARDDFSAHRQSMQQLSQIIHKQLLTLYRLQPVHIISYILKQKKCFKALEIKQLISNITEQLWTKSYNVKSVTKINSEQLFDDAISRLLQHKAVKINNDTIHICKPEIIDYYAASIESAGVIV